MQHISVTRENDGIALVTLANAAGPVNVVSPEWMDEFIQVVEQLAADSSVQGVIVTSAKRSFMVGADLKYLVRAYGVMTPVDAFELSQRASLMHRRLETCGKPFVAALNGTALGGGFELALACHYRVLADDEQARVGLPEVTVGLLPGSGGTQRLPRMVGMDRALALLLEGNSVAPAEALRLQIVDEVVPKEELLPAARAWLLNKADPVRAWDRKGFRMPASAGMLDPAVAATMTKAAAMLAARGLHNYPAPIAILASVFEGAQLPLDSGLRVESRYFAQLLTDPTARNIIRTNFLAKGRATSLAGRPADIPKFQVSKLGVIGAGMMGLGIAHVAAAAGIEVTLLDSTLELAEQAKMRLAASADKDVARGRQSAERARELLNRVICASSFDALRDADLVIEAVFEDSDLKAEVLRKAERVMRPDALLASNTSTLPITALAGAATRSDNFIGLHFFSPVERMALVEVIVGRQTTPATIARSLDFVAQLRKTPIVVNDSRGFYTSRVFQTFIHEGMAMLKEGIAPALIENVARQAGMPVGPLAVLDETSLELPLQIIEQARAELGSDYEPPPGYAVLKTMLEQARRPGRKAGAGFYDYPPEGKKRLWTGLSELFPARRSADPAYIKKRILYIQALETARCLEEGVLANGMDADLGAVLGWGFPLYTGGPLSLIDTIGVRNFVAECDQLSDQHGDRFQPSRELRRRAATNELFHAA
jgi:3-hydroxyacyl-CoA dehydrogenase/enoyl-CoA hydratase/3-hydroxybutyryl-CoA epimerase